MFDSSSETAPRRIVVVGSGTEIGKTHVSCALLEALVRRGLSATGFKPVESGWQPSQSDASKLARAAGHTMLEPCFALADPVSPHLAARREGRQIALEPVVQAVAEFETRAVVVETAGGLLSPLASGCLNLDLARACEPDDVVLVAANRLGVLHDVKGCLLALEGLQEVRVHVVLSDGEGTDASTNSNAEEIVALGWSSRCLTFPRQGLAETDTQLAADGLVTALGF